MRVMKLTISDRQAAIRTERSKELSEEQVAKKYQHIPGIREAGERIVCGILRHR